MLRPMKRHLSWLVIVGALQPAVIPIVTAMVPDAAGKIELPFWRGVVSLSGVTIATLVALFSEPPGSGKKAKAALELPPEKPERGVS